MFAGSIVDWPRLIRQVSLGSFPLKIEFTYDHVDSQTGFLTCHFAGDGRMIPARPLPVQALVSLAFGMATIRREAQMAVLHELDECLRILGVRVNDPHVNVPVPA